MTLLRALAARLPGEARYAQAYGADIQPCLDCRACWTGGGCVLHDGMDEVYENLAWANAVIVGSPLYYSELTGPLLSLASRFQCYYAARCLSPGAPHPHTLPPKAGAVVLVGGGDTRSIDRAERTARILLHEVNAQQVAPAVWCDGTNRLPARENRAALGAVRDLADALCQALGETPLSAPDCGT